MRTTDLSANKRHLSGNEKDFGAFRELMAPSEAGILAPVRADAGKVREIRDLHDHLGKCEPCRAKFDQAVETAGEVVARIRRELAESQR